jgi:hypothetical protein
MGKECEYNVPVHQPFTDFKKAYDSVRREVLYNILIEFGIPMKLERLIKICLNETYSKAHMDKNVTDSIRIKIDLNEKNRYHSCF